jgi:membrane protein
MSGREFLPPRIEDRFMAESTHDDERDDRRPASAYPRRPHRFSIKDWKQALIYVKESTTRDHLSIVAPGVAFYMMFGLVPALVALISIYGLVADPADVQQQFEGLEGAMPEQAHGLLTEQLSNIAAQQGAAGIGAILSILVALWAASRATLALMEGLNITYDTEERRGMMKRALVRFGLTLAAVVLAISAIGMIVVLPPVLNALPVPEALSAVLSLLRWPLLLLLGIVGLSLLYRFGPDREQPEFQWLSWGGALAAILWVVASALFSLYVANFGSYDKTYGTFGAIIILLTWLLLSAYVILIGAEVDAAFERQTRRMEQTSAV